MALVFKIKHKETLRRWVVSQTSPQQPSEFALSIDELLLKVRELFHFSERDALAVTYVDQEGDVVTIADDQDLLDACFVQRLNPLRLDVQILEAGENPGVESVADVSPNPKSPPPSHSDNNLDSESTSRPPFPQVTADDIKQFIAKCTHNMDPNRQPAVLISHIRKALKDFFKILIRESQKLSPRTAQPPFSGGATRPPCANQCPVGPDASKKSVHFGVRCDGCNVHPIRGLRYKSTKISNYDLCSECILKMGNESDYVRIEKPMNRPCHGSFHASEKGAPAKWANPFASGLDGWKSECPFLQIPLPFPIDSSKKYDASFVKDFSEFKGEDLEPCRQFSRTFRVKNNGQLDWPKGTCLADIGGHNFGLEPFVVLKLPEHGLLVGSEFDVVVDMKAPNKAGNYVCHWCLMTPNGEKFGQSIWVAVQVVGENKDSSHVEDVSQRDEIVELQDEMVHLRDECGKSEDIDASKVDGSSVSTSQDLASDHVDKDTGSAMQATGSGQFIVSTPKEGEEIVTYPTDEVDGFSLIEKPSEGGNYKMVHSPLTRSEIAPPQLVRVIDEQYGSMKTAPNLKQELNLHELEMMGFKNYDLNVMLLEKNDQDLQLTLDDLLLGSGWDNLLKDLLEMGFEDVNTNLRLLIKNEGSIKRVVRELVEREKDEGVSAV